MSDRDETKFTLWWTSSDRQGIMWGGNYDSHDKAEAAIEPLKEEMKSQLFDPADWDDGIWEIQPPDTVLDRF